MLFSIAVALMVILVAAFWVYQGFLSGMLFFIECLAALMVAVPAGTARAQVDCEAARCAVQEALNTDCPCDAATNHGKHVSCVAHVLKRLSKDGTIPTNCKGKVQRCAARSTCGKAGFVTCVITTEIGTCDLVTGTCVEDPALVCAADADCVLASKCKIKSSEERCLARGGTVGTASTCCAECAQPTPVPTATP